MNTSDRDAMVQMVLDQATRCRKPHLTTDSYPDRQRIEDWNDGVAALTREILFAINHPKESRRA